MTARAKMKVNKSKEGLTECLWYIQEQSKPNCIYVNIKQEPLFFEIKPETAEEIKRKIAEEKPEYLYFAGEDGALKFDVSKISFEGNVMKAYPIIYG